MTLDEIKIGTRLTDTTNGQSGTVLNWHKPANPNVESDLVAIRIAGNAIVWSHACHLELQ